MLIDRRQALWTVAIASLLPTKVLAIPGAPRGPLLPNPTFPASPDTTPLRVKTGLRPFRAGTYKLEPEQVGMKYVVHNYGHGGAGITMSWGCAEEVASLVRANDANVPNKDVAILGGGVMGMTAAAVLQEKGYKTTIYATDFTPHTTSDVAGGQWAPSVVEHADRPRHMRILNTSFGRHVANGTRYGVSRRDNYTHNRSSELDDAAEASGLARERVELLPFRQIFSGGYKYPTLLVEPPIFLAALRADIQRRGGRDTFVKKTFRNPQDVEELRQPTVVNCLGLGSKTVWPDPALSGRKGVLAMLDAQPELQYLYSGIGYMFPRQDHVVIGGSLEWEDRIDTSLSDLDKARLIVKVVRAVFQGAIPIPDWLSGGSRVLGADMIRSTDRYGGPPPQNP